MAVVRPFRPFRYNPHLIPDLGRVVAPPYDVIDAAQREALYRRDRHNVIRLILNREADPYAAAASTLHAWIEQGILVRERRPVICYHVERFTLPDGTERKRAGAIATVRLEHFERGIIRPHERTFARAKEDRTRLLRACRMNLSPIFGLYADRAEGLDPARAVAAGRAPDVAFQDGAGVHHQLWFVDDAVVMGAITEPLANEPIFIADGHHRYETALAYRDEMAAHGAADPEAPHNFILMYLTSADDSGVVILPTHRILHGSLPVQPSELLAGLRQLFRVEAIPHAARRRFLERLQHREAGCLGIALAGAEALYLVTVKDGGDLDSHLEGLAPVLRRLDVTLVEQVLLRRLAGIDPTQAARGGLLSYTHDDHEALDAVRQGASAAFLMKPPRIQDVMEVCLAGRTMPEKSTYFFPKLVTGLVFHSLVVEDTGTT